MKLASGGTISYAYTGGNNGIFSDGSTSGLKRYTPDTGSSAYWNYSRKQETGAASITTVTDPTAQANQKVTFNSRASTRSSVTSIPVRLPLFPLFRFQKLLYKPLAS